jgi:hypothetical protein
MKRRCVLGVLKTEEGLRIKEEMLAWLESKYEVFVIEQEVPGKLYEWPALKFAADLSENSMEPVLYLHTKGAGNPREQQRWVRNFWRDEFVGHIDQYFEAVDVLNPTVVAPIVSKKNRICWFNGFVINPLAAKELNKNITLKTDRMWYEQGMLTSCTNIDCVGILSDCADKPEDGWDEFVKYLSYRVGIVALAKDEGRYLMEWLEYHAKIGITDFFIFDNNDPLDNSQAVVIEEFKKHNPNTSIQLYDIRGREKLEKLGFQVGVYNYITTELQKDRHSARWIAYIDIDEFIHLDKQFPTIQSFLWSDEFRGCDQVHLNWKCFGDNGMIHYEDGPVRDRFKQPAAIECIYNDEIDHSENQYVKNIVRLSSKMRNSQAHTAYMMDGVCLNALGERIEGNTPISDKIIHQRAWIDHYCTKSLEEYIDRKCLYQLNIANADPVDINKRIRWYFNLNEKTDKKLDYIKKRLGYEYT